MRDVMSVKELAEYLGISRHKVYESVVERRKIPIPFTRIGRKIIFHRGLVDEFLENNRIDKESQI